MGFGELLLLALGLSMDAFAAAVCRGLALRRVTAGQLVTVGLWFGGFQALMPLLGWLTGTCFAQTVAALERWVTFGLLAVLGGGMLREAFCPAAQAAPRSAAQALAPAPMLGLAVATSIDALTAGIPFAFWEVSPLPACLCIGGTAFALSAAGVWVGSRFGERYKSRAELAGGILLILLGLKILLAEGGCGS